MKLRNKKTGEIIEAESCNNACGCISIYYEEKDGQIGTKDCYTSLAELNEEWEDYEEPKISYFINWFGEATELLGYLSNSEIEKLRGIGNYFETKEEADKAVDKLKAWKRLKDEGIRIFSFKKEKRGIDLDYYTLTILAPRDKESLDLLFGGEE